MRRNIVRQARTAARAEALGWNDEGFGVTSAERPVS
jgi:hypothetical protein